MADYYNAVLIQYGFELPTDYRYLDECGFLTFSKSATAAASTKPACSYLWIPEMEWLAPSAIAAHRFPDYCLPGFVPFAFNGAGDYWCWQTSFGGVQPSRVVFCPHDYQYAMVVGDSLAMAVFRQILEYLCYDVGEDTLERTHQHLTRWTTDLAPIFLPEWIKSLKPLLDRPLQEYVDDDESCIGLLTPTEKDIIEKSLISPSEFIDEFQWMR